MTPARRSSARTVLLLGSTGTGKTTLAEALLGLGGVRSSRGGLLDHEPEETRRGHSLSLAAGAFAWRDDLITVLDAPGAPESSGDAYPALAAADIAVFVVDASSGVGPQHDVLWDACDRLATPRMVFLNKFDAPQAAYQTHVDALRARYGKALAPVHMPIGVGPAFTGVVDLLRLVAVERVEGERVERPLPEHRREQAERNREFLVEAIVENDDALLEGYLEGQVPDVATLRTVFARGIAGCGFFPVLCGSATLPIGVRWLADFLVDEGPSPERDGAPAACIVKTYSDPYVGRISLLRVARGDVTSESTLAVARTGRSVRLHHPFRPQGAQQEPITSSPAGSVIGCAKLEDVRTGDVLSADGAAADVVVPSPPKPQHRTAIAPASSGDEDRLSAALSRLAEEDPALVVERDPDTGQTVLRSYGPEHVAVSKERLARKFGVEIVEEPLRIAYRETVRGTARGLGRYVKQSGGHGQYGVAEIEISPLPRGEGFQFRDEIVGGVIPRQFIPSVEKGVLDAMAHGVLAGYPVTDVAVRLLDGKHHSVDSSDMAFQAAGSLAFRDAAAQAGIVMLEPVMRVDVVVPDDLVGDVMGDLSARRGRIQGTEQVPGPTAVDGRTKVSAMVPLAELSTYVPELRSLTSGAGTVDITYDHHDLAPAPADATGA